MALRRFAQENNAAASPRSPEGRPPPSPLNPFPPSTPRRSFGIHRSPADTPSISSSVPFDWDAARSRAPPPYSTPMRGRKSVGTATPSGTSRKAIIRQKGIIEQIRNVPSTIAFEIALFPHNVPLPTPKTTARIIGGSIHIVHFFLMAIRESEEGWDALAGTKQSSWFDWTTPIALLLVSFSMFNAYNLATRNRSYKFHRRKDPLASPHAKFIVTNLDLEPVAQPSLSRRVRAKVWYAFSYFWRFLLGFQPPSKWTPPREKTSRVQELEVWEPSEMELELFSIYSPAHALVWLVIGSSNWVLSLLIMILIGVQLNVIVHAYSQLLKDKQLIASETMKEYNDVFVNPRVNPVRRDVAVMTHQSEVVNVWEE